VERLLREQLGEELSSRSDEGSPPAKNAAEPRPCAERGVEIRVRAASEDGAPRSWPARGRSPTLGTRSTRFQPPPPDGGPDPSIANGGDARAGRLGADARGLAGRRNGRSIFALPAERSVSS
jgi:hypothetical protein